MSGSAVITRCENASTFGSLRARLTHKVETLRLEASGQRERGNTRSETTYNLWFAKSAVNTQGGNPSPESPTRFNLQGANTK